MHTTLINVYHPYLQFLMTEIFDKKDHKSNDCHNSEYGTKIQFTLRLMVVFWTLYGFKTTLLYWCHICLTSQPLPCDPVKWSVRRQTGHTDKQTNVCTCAMQYAYIFHLLGTLTDHICTVVHFIDQKLLPTSATYLSPDSQWNFVCFFMKWTKRWKDVLLSLIDWRVY